MLCMTITIVSYTGKYYAEALHKPTHVYEMCKQMSTHTNYHTPTQKHTPT